LGSSALFGGEGRGGKGTEREDLGGHRRRSEKTVGEDFSSVHSSISGNGTPGQIRTKKDIKKRKLPVWFLESQGKRKTKPVICASGGPEVPG